MFQYKIVSINLHSFEFHRFHLIFFFVFSHFLLSLAIIPNTGPPGGDGPAGPKVSFNATNNIEKTGLLRRNVPVVWQCVRH